MGSRHPSQCLQSSPSLALLALPHQGHYKLASQPHRPRSLTLRPSVGIRATRQHQWPQRSSPMPSMKTTTSTLPSLSEIHPAVRSHMLFSEELVSSTHQPPALSQSSLLLP